MWGGASVKARGLQCSTCGAMSLHDVLLSIEAIFGDEGGGGRGGMGGFARQAQAYVGWCLRMYWLGVSGDNHPNGLSTDGGRKRFRRKWDTCPSAHRRCFCPCDVHSTTSACPETVKMGA